MLVIKIGGGRDIDLEAIAKNAAELAASTPIVLVHGANALRDELGAKLGVPTRTITSPAGITSVHTDAEALDVFLMAYCGLANKKLVALLRRHGVAAVGLSGVDGVWTAKRKPDALAAGEDGKTRLIRNNLTGRVEKADAGLLRALMELGRVPVLCPPALSYENEMVNVDNDAAVAVTAGALGADTIVSLFEAPGLLRDPQDPASLIPSVAREELQDHIQYASGRMKKKVLGAQKALELGVRTIYWGDGRIENPISAALAGGGTTIS